MRSWFARGGGGGEGGSETNGDGAVDKPLVLLVHGLGVSGRYMWPLARELARRAYPVWTPDLPGHGRSPRPTRPLTLGELAAVTRATLDLALDVAAAPTAIVVGNSYACQILVELLASDDHDIDACVLLGPTMDTHYPGAPRHALDLICDQVFEPVSPLPMQAFDYAVSGARRTRREYADGADGDLRARIAHARVPLVVARGEHDPICSRAWCDELVAAAPCDALDVGPIEAPGAGHALNYNSPAIVAGLVDRVTRARGA